MGKSFVLTTISGKHAVEACQTTPWQAPTAHPRQATPQYRAAYFETGALFPRKRRVNRATSRKQATQFQKKPPPRKKRHPDQRVAVSCVACIHLVHLTGSRRSIMRHHINVMSIHLGRLPWLQRDDYDNLTLFTSIHLIHSTQLQRQTLHLIMVTNP